MLVLVSALDKEQPQYIHYKNCILLTQHNELNQLNTKIFKIIEIWESLKLLEIS
jgi:hypothetical protein